MTQAKHPAHRAHYLLKFCYVQLKAENISLIQAAKDSGVSYNTLKDAMQGKSNISLGSMEALMNYLGYSMKPTPLPYPKKVAA